MIYILPNGAEWDDELPIPDQTEEAQNFWQSVIDENTPLQVTEPSINPNMDRLLSQTWTATNYETYNYKVVSARTYQNAAMSSKAFAISNVSVNYEILLK
tara:strand:+ start:339 stop:638 length:300 start_codon:yes stop_codon:yes gene_type:complete